MTSFGWLHLTDLHWGMAAQKPLWPRLKQKFFDDIPRLHDESGPWDLVLFTGDLTQKGEHFDSFDGVLSDCWDLFEKCGSRPALLTVPGNHDLVRPDKRDPGLRLLKHWDEETQSEFWEDETCVCRKTVTTAFTPYSQWWDAQTLRPAIIEAGMLPGDFAATIQKNGAKLGILGLNTTFLQLTEGDYKGKLALHAQQFQRACKGDGPAWAQEHHACLLLTHQPPDWLTPDAQTHLTSEIADAGQFVVHLFGHMHEAMYRATGAGGSELRRELQGRSLFGLEYFKGDKGDVVRSHGYSAGRIELHNDKGTITFWPRNAIRDQSNTWAIAADQSYRLPNHVHTKPAEISLLQPHISQRTKSVPSISSLSASLSALRDTLERLEELMESFTDIQHEGQRLKEQILNAMRRERGLQGFRREGANL